MRKAVGALAAFLALSLIAVPAWALQLTGSGDELASRPIKSAVIVPPEYPKQALAQGKTATLEVVALVKVDGTLTNWRISALPEEEAFATALREVLPYWIAEPRLDNQTCRGKEGEFSFQVWFEIGEGKPKISVSQRAQESPEEAKAALAKSEAAFRIKSQVEPHYPRKALRDGVEGTVKAIVQVDRSGAVKHVDVRPALRRVWFEESVIKALSRWEFEILPGFPEGKPHVCGEVTITFLIRG